MIDGLDRRPECVLETAGYTAAYENIQQELEKWIEEIGSNDSKGFKETFNKWASFDERRYTVRVLRQIHGGDKYKE